MPILVTFFDKVLSRFSTCSREQRKKQLDWLATNTYQLDWLVTNTHHQPITFAFCLFARTNSPSENRREIKIASCYLLGTARLLLKVKNQSVKAHFCNNINLLIYIISIYTYQKVPLFSSIHLLHF